MQPTIGRIVHYVARGSADGKFPPACRAATITEVSDAGRVGLMVANPTGLFFHPLDDNGGCEYHDGAETPGSPDCPNDASHGSPFRYCACGWIEASHRGGTWHWPERV